MYNYKSDGNIRGDTWHNHRLASRSWLKQKFTNCCTLVSPKTSLTNTRMKVC